MKKKIDVLLIVMILALALSLGTCGGACAETLADDLALLRTADSFDGQLAALDKIATENATELEAGGWENDYTVDPAPGLPDGIIPANWETAKFTECDGLPEGMRDHKFIALYCPGNDSQSLFAGELLAHFPTSMRASSLAEAEYALIVRWELVDSGYEYIPPANSSHRDYAAYAVNVRTGEITRFWETRNSAKTSGKWGQLNGDLFSQEELWTLLRGQFYHELKHKQADGAVLVFGVTGKNCYLKSVEAANSLTELNVPSEVEGYTVTEIAEACLQGNQTLRTIILHEGLTHISEHAFEGCIVLENVSFPDTLETIGDSAFSHCQNLQNIILPESLHTLGNDAFCNTSSITSITLRGSLGLIGEGALENADKLASVVVSEGIARLPENLFSGCFNLACCYFPASLTTGLDLVKLDENTTIYAPENSYALTWAAENGYACVACMGPDDMPNAEYIVEGDMEYRIFDGEAALFAYLGNNADVIIPEAVDGYPITRLLTHAVYKLDKVVSVMLPQSVRWVNASAIYAVEDGPSFHVYVKNLETCFAEGAIGRYGYDETKVTIHAPEGSLAQRFVVETAEDEPLVFEPWGDGIDSDKRSLSDALLVAAQLQQSVVAFWETCDQNEYSWISNVQGYVIDKPDKAIVLRVTQTQFDELALLMGGADDVANDLAVIINTKYNLPYAKAAAQTMQAVKLDPVPDGSCAFVLLAYQTDIMLITINGDGNAQGVLLCSSPDVTKQLTAEYISGIAAQYGVAGECKAYNTDALAFDLP